MCSFAVRCVIWTRWIGKIRRVRIMLAFTLFLCPFIESCQHDISQTPNLTGRKDSTEAWPSFIFQSLTYFPSLAHSWGKESRRQRHGKGLETRKKYRENETSFKVVFLPGFKESDKLWAPRHVETLIQNTSDYINGSVQIRFKLENASSSLPQKRFTIIHPNSATFQCSEFLYGAAM